MNKLVFTIVAIGLLNFAPLAARPELILHYKSILLAIAAACLWLSQPAFSTAETKRDQTSDRFSIVVILIMSSLCVVTAVSEWAYMNHAEQSSLALTLVGAALLLGGIGIRIWAIRTLGKHFTATVTLTDDHQLVKDGPYRWVRHPSYLGAFMALVGCPVFLNAHWAILIAVAAMTIAYYLRIGVEEKMLSAYFGQRYLDYKKDTKRIIPFIW
ncbi:MAG: isoprenylcysteine carboxylmethyltransferase family protein [Sediminibacterium sp.]|nr:isoprenylcysteine carboxylmethyltransferase family protein [Sediminibacterium sp.]